METLRFTIFKKIEAGERNNLSPRYQTIISTSNYDIVSYSPIDIETGDFNNEALIHNKLEKLYPQKYVIDIYSTLDNFSK